MKAVMVACMADAAVLAGRCSNTARIKLMVKADFGDNSRAMAKELVFGFVKGGLAG